MSAPHIFFAIIVPKFLQFVEIWQSSGKNNLYSFLRHCCCCFNFSFAI